MEQIDEADSVFKDTLRVYTKGFPDSIYLSNKANDLISNLQINLRNMKNLQPSKAAAKFNGGIIQYLKAINDYGKTAKQMLQAKAVDEKRKSYAQLNVEYEKLNAYPDSLLAIQQVYLQEVGLQPK